MKVLDLSSRLPGPYAGYCLALLGAKVFKVENTDWDGDPFNQKEVYEQSAHFKDWYQNLNHKKVIESFSFGSEEEKLIEHIRTSQLVIAPKSKKLKNLIEEHAIAPCSIVYVSASKPMHDLNALGETITFKDHLKLSNHPPYLPFAGLAYGQFLAQVAQNQFIRALEKNSKESSVQLIDEVSKKLFDVLASENEEALHLGVFPCYQIYTTADHKHICLAAVEEHYWSAFCQCFNLDLAQYNRFDRSGETQEKLRKLFTKLDSSEIKDKIKDQQFCLTLI